ncbi:hypothetical protein AB0N93_22230 [Streptomyces sp. NPDC091267]|uniref:hypothetical protein n=1 Tax=Streptomyces sp. NPDC091267 TaxID=3155195 RepID=UPI00342BCBF7
MSHITDLWTAGKAPSRSGLYRADGSARTIETDGPALSRFALGPPLDLDALLAESPLSVTEIDIHPQCFVALPDRSGFICGGDGALGSDGFFARLDAGRSPLWVASMCDSNPFEKAELRGWVACFTNNLGNSVVVDLLNADFDAQ